MTAWHSLYLARTDTTPIVQTLQQSLAALGYTLFNPFGLIPGRAYRHAVRLFVAPPAGGWVRVIGEPEARFLPSLAQLALCLSVSLDGVQARIAVYANGAEAGADALVPYLRPGCTANDLQPLLANPDLTIVQKQPDALPFAALPDDVRAMAGGVDMRQAQNMFARLTGSLMKRAGDADSAALAEAAQGLIAAGHPPDWDSPGGRRIHALMDCLTIPDGWRDPDFVTLRDAYQVHERRRRKPDADLYPGDAEAMAHVMNALDYVPVYAGADG